MPKPRLTLRIRATYDYGGDTGAGTWIDETLTAFGDDAAYDELIREIDALGQELRDGIRDYKTKPAQPMLGEPTRYRIEYLHSQFTTIDAPLREPLETTDDAELRTALAAMNAGTPLLVNGVPCTVDSADMEGGFQSVKLRLRLRPLPSA